MSISELPEDIPDEAKPDCDNCPKPELLPGNYEAVQVYYYVWNQQNWIGMEGYRGGVRTEALAAAMAELEASGVITNRERVYRRVLLIDGVVNVALNARREAESSAAS